MWQISPDFISLVIQKHFFHENGIGMKFCIILYQKKECSCDTILLTNNLNLYFNAFSPCCAIFDSQGTDEKNLVIGQDLSHFLTFSIFLTTLLFDRPSDITRWCDFAQLTSNRIRSHNLMKIAFIIRKKNAKFK